MGLTAGVRLGSYVVGAPIGVGGMGEVYRATDTTLKRAVALKVLPASVASDADRLARFLREAEALASLNHPNIASIYGLERSQGITALVLELVEGPTLADRIARGPIPVDEALLLARQIASALEAAHEQGLIHRDLKPANIKVRPDGTVKVLDFGLAKVLRAPSPLALGSDEETGDGVADASTELLSSLTQTGIILGTPAYMSPEQARGHPLDARADVWAFGCVAYEMLTARRAFRGADVPDILAAVLRDEPDWARLPAALPATVRSYVRRCLAKDPRQRVQAIGDVRLAIEGAFEPAVAAGAPASPGYATASALMEAAGTPRSDSQRTTTRGAGAIVASLGLGLVGVLLLVTVLGFIASRVIDGGLGRSGSFVEVEPPLAYTRWGLMQFTAPLVLVVAPLLIALVVLRVIGRVLVVIPPVRRLWRPVQALSSQTTARIAAMPVRSLGETLLVVQLIALVAYVWRYSPVLSGLANFALPDLLAGDLRQLRPGNVDIHEEWRAVASLQLVAFGVAWYNVVRKRQMSQQTGGGAALAGGLALLMLTALLFAMPYRVLFHAELERVMVGTERCYEAARQASEILVFCPERPTGRSSRMALDDPSLTRTGIIESIFSVFDEPRP